MPLLRLAILCVGLFLPFSAAGEESPPWRVLVLLGSDFSLPLSVTETNALRAALTAGTPRRIEFYTEALDANRLPFQEYEADFAAFLSRKYQGRKPDIIIAVQIAALDFAERHRAMLWPGVPIVFCAMPASWIEGRAFGAGITGVTTTVDPAGTLELARRLQPDARQVVVVGGVGEVDRTLAEGVRQALRRHEGSLQATWLDHHAFRDMNAALERLPANTIVFYTAVSRDAEGRVFTPREALERLARISGAPLYGMIDTYAGHGIAGGSILNIEVDAQRAAAVALRVLGGESPDAIPVGPPAPAACRVDERELRRFGLPERLLPKDCRIEFHEPGLWEAHRGEILFILAAILLQATAIVALLVQRRLRRQAELAAREQLVTLAHAGRLAVAGELSAAIAHELNQPLAAILSNAEAAELLLASSPTPLAELRQILADIRADDVRAGEVIRQLRMLLSKHAPKMVPLDLDVLAGEVLRLLTAEARRRNVTLETECAAHPPVRGDRVQLQQVLLNLILNAMEAMEGTPPAQRRIVVRIATAGPGDAEVAVRDNGHGIPGAQLPHVFDAFRSTKGSGMGLGLSIARYIVEAHGGRIRAENNAEGGATLRFTLPGNGRRA